MLADIFGPSAALSQYEQYLCKLNWTAVMMEMMQQDSVLKEYIDLQVLLFSSYVYSRLGDLESRAFALRVKVLCID